jgi:2-C-methyl-D-erythritol 4-phosphate cytidylyltransferase
LNTIALIVAGGAGKRMQSTLPKQFIEIGGKPLLYYVLELFRQTVKDIEIILVLPELHIKEWETLCEKHQIHTPHNVVEGGPTRFHSVKNGLKAIRLDEKNTVVAIHDGVRPFVDRSVIINGFDIAEKCGSAIPVIPCFESMREVNGAFSKSLQREKLCIVQTPQFFHLHSIRSAYNISYSEVFTDDASVFETTGRQVTLINGNKENVKITLPSDILYANALIMEKF